MRSNINNIVWPEVIEHYYNSLEKVTPDSQLYSELRMVIYGLKESGNLVNIKLQATLVIEW